MSKITKRILGASAAVALSAGIGFATAAPASADIWDEVAQCESSGDWSINTGNGYYGGLQFSLETWRGYGGTGMPNEASVAEQKRIAQRVLEGQGPGAWPVCSQEAGLTSENGMIGDTSETDTSTQSSGSYSDGSASSSTSAEGSGEYVTVQSGDTLAIIADEYGVDGGWEALYDINADTVSDPNMIYVGQELELSN